MIWINLLICCLKNKNISTSTILERDFIDMGQWKFYLNYLKILNKISANFELILKTL